MRPQEYAEVIHGLTGLSQRLYEQVATLEAAGCHAVCGDAARYLEPIARNLGLASNRLRQLSAPPAP